MSFLMRQVAHCDVCGHEWLTNMVPSHCAKCKSRKWNQGAAQTAALDDIQYRRVKIIDSGDPRFVEVLPERTVEYEE